MDGMKEEILEQEKMEETMDSTLVTMILVRVQVDALLEVALRAGQVFLNQLQHQILKQD